MERPARLFNCARCNRQVVICSQCDRGQIYCSEECSQKRRLAACRAADARYQKTQRGKLKHAERQRQYRQRQKEKKEIVTDHPSLENSDHDVLPAGPNESKTPQTDPIEKEICCHFCKKAVSEFIRFNFLGADRGNSLSTKCFRSKSLKIN